MNDKLTGSFYTPEELVNYMVTFAMKKYGIQRVLEPSFGDGRFIKNLRPYPCIISGVELETEKVIKMQSDQGENETLFCMDFIEFALDHKERYDLIIGNPPYISKKKISTDKRLMCEKILHNCKLPTTIFQNLWVMFILSSINLLNRNGAIFFVLPFEFLQVKYAEIVRNFLEERFNTIEIITFEKSVFTSIEQDVCLVYLTNEAEAKPYIKYTTVDHYKTMKIVHDSTIMKNKPLPKWSNCILNDRETELLFDSGLGLNKINKFGNISPGIVTGANDFFIINNEMIKSLSINENMVLPIIQKSSSINNGLVFSSSDFNDIKNNKEKKWLINLNQMNELSFNSNLKSYLSNGVNIEINKRYKCAARNRWYDVPIIKKGEVFFFKRYDVLPKLIINDADVYTTDIAYNIRLHDHIDKYSFAFCFYNSLTIALCEYNGRFYGGGVCELVPSEFKNLSIPYMIIDKKQIEHLDQMFKRKERINYIIDYVDNIVFKDRNINLSLLREIRNRFLFRRIKRSIEKYI